MKTLTIKTSASSVNNGKVNVELLFSLKGSDGNYYTEIECKTPGFSFGGQTSGYVNSLASTSKSENEGSKMVIHGKKALLRLNSNFLYLYKIDEPQNKKDRYIISFYNIDLSPLLRNDKFKIYEEKGNQIIERLVYPRFKGVITMGELSDIENIVIIDECFDPLELAKAMRSASEFMRKGHYKK